MNTFKRYVVRVLYNNDEYTAKCYDDFARANNAMLMFMRSTYGEGVREISLTVYKE